MKIFVSFVLLCILNLFQDLFIFSPYCLQATVIGSDTSVERQGASTVPFPLSGIDNEMRGFTLFENGFLLETGATTCTFNAVFPASDFANIGGGVLYLNKDLVFENPARFLVPGRIRSDNKTIVFPKSERDVFIPYLNENKTKVFMPITSVTPASVRSVATVDWSYDGNYIALGRASGPGEEVFAYGFDGSTLTANGSLGVNTSFNKIRWHPYLLYFAAACTVSGGDDLFIYRLDPPPTSTITNTGGGLLAGGTAYFMCAWHPGGVYLVAGSDYAGGELEVWTFDTGTETLTGPVRTDVTPDRAVRALSFSPGGDYLAVGTSVNGVSPTLLVYSFDPVGPVLTPVASIYTGAQINTLDWSPTGTYIAVGHNSGTDTVRVYSFYSGTSTLTEEISARIGEASVVTGVHWDNSGDLLVYGTSAGASSLYTTYYFEKSNAFMFPVNAYISPYAINGIRWSRDNKFIVYADGVTSNSASVLGVSGTPEPIVYDGVTLELNAPTYVNKNWKFRGECTVNGNGKTLTIGTGYSIELVDNAQLTLQNMTLNNIGNTNLCCLTDAGVITLQDCALMLSRDFTFSQGALIFEKDIIISGTSKFNYTSVMTSTINQKSMLYLDNGVTFNYAPIIGNKNLLVMSDVTSGLYLDGANLAMTTTGLCLSVGTLYIDNHVTVSSQATSIGEAFEIAPSLKIVVQGDGLFDMFGIMKYA